MPEEKICPICKKKFIYPAISRKDNKTEICPDCGVKEALEDWRKYNNQKEITHDNSRS